MTAPIGIGSLPPLTNEQVSDTNLANSAATLPVHMAAHDWSLSLPDRPQHYATPSMLSRTKEERDQARSGLVQYEPDPLLNMPFLSTVSPLGLTNGGVNEEGIWTYECRRQAQMILPYLFLGPFVAAKDMGFLTREHITMIIAVHADTALARIIAENAFRKAASQGVVVENYFTRDHQQLTATLARTTSAINEHLKARFMIPNGSIDPPSGRVLVCCESGNDKSAAVAASYLSETFLNIDPAKAMSLINAKRYCCYWDEILRSATEDRYTLVRAKRNVMIANIRDGLPSNAGDFASTLHRKRGREIDEADEEMVDASAEDDAQRFLGRQNTPFV